MKVMVLGVGTVGKAVVLDLLENWKVDEVLGVDYNVKEVLQ